ncbi:retrotransposon protein [Hordeum vulgare]|nr:retrotransposon protein [Hordeum vulgare]
MGRPSGSVGQLGATLKAHSNKYESTSGRRVLVESSPLTRGGDRWGRLEAGLAESSLLSPAAFFYIRQEAHGAIKVEANLDAAGLWEAVVPPEDAAATVIVKKDKPARAYLLSALAEDLLLEVSPKKTAAEVWASLRARYVGADRVRAMRLGTLRGEFEFLRMEEDETLDQFAGKLKGMTTRFAGLGSTLEDDVLVKKLLDSVPDRVYAAVAGIEQFCDVSTMAFDEALGRLKAFDERLRRRGQGSGAGEEGELMLTAEQWRARERRGRAGARDNDDAGAWHRALEGIVTGVATTAMNVATSRGSVRGGRKRRHRSEL